MPWDIIFPPGSSPSEGSSSYVRVDTHANLPVTVGTPAVGSIYLVENSTGIWLINRKVAGLWRRVTDDGDLDDWERIGNWLEVFRDSNFELSDDADPTKSVKVQVGGVSSGATRTLSVPDKDGTILVDSDIGTMAQRDVTISTGDPVGGSDGDIHFKYVP